MLTGFKILSAFTNRYIRCSEDFLLTVTPADNPQCGTWESNARTQSVFLFIYGAFASFFPVS